MGESYTDVIDRKPDFFETYGKVFSSPDGHVFIVSDGSDNPDTQSGRSSERNEEIMLTAHSAGGYAFYSCWMSIDGEDPVHFVVQLIEEGYPSALDMSRSYHLTAANVFESIDPWRRYFTRDSKFAKEADRLLQIDTASKLVDKLYSFDLILQSGKFQPNNDHWLKEIAKNTDHVGTHLDRINTLLLDAYGYITDVEFDPRSMIAVQLLSEGICTEFDIPRSFLSDLILGFYSSKSNEERGDLYDDVESIISYLKEIGLINPTVEQICELCLLGRFDAILLPEEEVDTN